MTDNSKKKLKNLLICLYLAISCTFGVQITPYVLTQILGISLYQYIPIYYSIISVFVLLIVFYLLYYRGTEKRWQSVRAYQLINLIVFIIAFLIFQIIFAIYRNFLYKAQRY